MTDPTDPTAAASEHADEDGAVAPPPPPARLLDNLRVVLFETQDQVNIGATIRAMKNMGADRLRLVRPEAYDTNRLEQVAHDTRDLVARIEHHDSVDSAVADCVMVAAFTRRTRAARWPVADVRPAMGRLLAAAAEGPVAIVFGREDHGLPNEVIDRAHMAVTIPTTEHASLNLAQAVLVALYELHMHAGDATHHARRGGKVRPPTAAEMERAFTTIDHALDAIAFFRTRNRELVMRTVRSLTMRAHPDLRELTLMRSMSFEVLRTIERTRRETLVAAGLEAPAGGVPPGFELQSPEEG